MTMNFTPVHTELWAHIRDLKDETKRDERHLVVGWHTLDPRVYGEMMVPVVLRNGVAVPLYETDNIEVKVFPR